MGETIDGWIPDDKAFHCRCQPTSKSSAFHFGFHFPSELDHEADYKIIISFWFLSFLSFPFPTFWTYQIESWREQLGNRLFIFWLSSFDNYNSILSQEKIQHWIG